MEGSRRSLHARLFSDPKEKAPGPGSVAPTARQGQGGGRPRGVYLEKVRTPDGAGLGVGGASPLLRQEAG